MPIIKVMRKKIGMIFLSLFMMGCNSVVSDYVGGAKRSPDSGQQPIPSPTPVITTSSPQSYKITPGRLNSTLTGGTGGVIQGTLTPTQRKLTLGSDMAMTVTISRSRLQPQ